MTEQEAAGGWATLKPVLALESLLHCHTSNKAKTPTALLAESLEAFRGCQHSRQVDHLGSPLRKIACCSTRPDQSGRSRQASTARSLWIICRAPSSVRAASSCALKVSTASQRA